MSTVGPNTGYKRRRYSQGGRITKRRRTTGSFKQTGFRRGFSRTAGYYGRFAPSGGELKFFDVDVDDAVVAANGTIQNSGSINNIVQGTGEQNRIGRKCVIKKINWRGIALLTNIDAQASTNDNIRIIMYLDKQCNGASIAVTDLLETDAFLSFNNLANSQRFRILVDKTIKLTSVAGAWTGAGTEFGANSVNFEIFKDVNIPLEFNSTTGAIAEIRSNNIGVLLLGTDGIASFTSKVRLRFSDN